MTWGEFVDLVESHLAVEANRRGMEAFRARYMKNAVLDLQRYIAGYRQGNVTTYTAAQVSLMTRASLGQLPPQAKAKAFYLVCAEEDSAVTSWTELAAVATVDRALNSLLYFVEEATGLLQVMQLRTGSDATDIPAGIVRPSDWDATTNAKIWYKVN